MSKRLQILKRNYHKEKMFLSKAENVLEARELHIHTNQVIFLAEISI